MKNIATHFQPRRLLPSLTSGFMVGLFDVVLSLSFAALIFSEALSGYVANGIGLALFSGIVINVMIALFSSFPGMVGSNQSVPAVILAIVAVSITTAMPLGASSQEMFVTAVAAIALTTLITGLFFLGLGQFKLAGLVRFLPYPVVGGFLAGTGWLLVSGAIGLMADTAATLPTLFTPKTLVYWLPGLFFALLLLLLTNRFDHFLLLPGALVGGVALFFLITALLGYSPAELSTRGWFLGPFPAQSLWPPLSPADLTQINWAAIWGQTINAATILIVSTVALLLNVSALEVMIDGDIDFDQEMRAAGLGNILAGLGGGLVGYQQLSLSALNVKLSTASRLVGLAAAAVSLFVLVWGAAILSFFPKVVLGGLLLYLGLTFLQEWVVQAWFKFPKIDYAIIFLILIVIALVGFLEGVALGFVATVIMFVVSYSRTDLVRHELSGSSYQSRVTRSAAQRHMLDKVGNKVYIAQLQGFIFFGTADKLMNRIRCRIEAAGTDLVQYVALDFSRVTGMDSTALLSFHKLKQVAALHQITLILTEVRTAVYQQMISGGLVEGNGRIRFFADLDQGVEWCENELLQQAGVTQNDKPIPLSQQLAQLLPDGVDLTQLLCYLKPQVVDAGEHIMLQGDTPEFLFFVESGQVTAQLERPGRSPVRLETMGNGRVVGEIGFYLSQDRTASIIADEPSVLYGLSRKDLQRIEQENPEAAATLHLIIVHLLAERVTHLVSTVNALQR